MHKTGVLRTLLAGSAAIVSIGTAYGQAPGPAGTAAGTPIVNTAQASYTVSGVQQSVTSNEARFLVDLKVNLTVSTNQTGNTQVSVGLPAAVTTFKVTNNTNGTLDFLLSANQLFTGLANGDNFDVTNVRIFVDSNTNGKYDVGVDTATYINELPADQSAVVFVVGDVPDVQSVAYAGIALIAQAAAGGNPAAQGAPLAATVGLNSDTAVDIVFADGDSGFGDTAYNGQGRATLAYEITTRNVQLTVTKSVYVVSDPISGSVTPKAIPGAIVQYCLVVNNATALTAANNVTLTDVVPANTTYLPGSITIGGLAAGSACVLNGFPVNDSGAPVALSPYSGSFNDSTKTVSATIPVLAGGLSLAAGFRVTIK